MSRYAARTSVPVQRSKAEIEDILTRYGASAFASGWGEGKAVIQFDAAGRRIRFELPLPIQPEKRLDAWEQQCRQRWRCLVLILKAKLEAVESGITTIEDEFLAHIVLPGGKTLGQWARPQVAEAYKNNRLPPMLPGATADGELVQ